MSISSDVVVPLDDIFFCQESNGFACVICTVDAFCQDRQNHLASPRHVRTVERFNLIFDVSYNRMACKLCAANFDRTALKQHANWHRIVPWFEPEDRYNKFFRHHIIEWETQFYCYPCDAFFPEWSTAYIHMTDQKHREAARPYLVVNDFSWWTTTPVPFDIFVSEAMVCPPASRTVNCTVCKCSNIGMRNVAEHVQGIQHKTMKVAFVKELSDWKDHKVEMPKNRRRYKEFSANTELNCTEEDNYPSKAINHNFQCIYIVEDGENGFCCKVCDLEFSDRSAVDDHVRGVSHAAAKKKYGCENVWLRKDDWVYHCSSCDCPILGIRNVHQHVRGTRHKISSSKMTESSIEQKVPENQNIPVGGRSVQQVETVADPGFLLATTTHIETLNNQEMQCRLCNDFVFVNSNLQKHLTNATHLSKTQQLTKYISHKEANDYWCKCCNLTISGFENIYRHVNGFRHTKHFALTNNQEKQNDDTASLSKTMELSKKQELPTNKNISVNGQSMKPQAETLADPGSLLATMTHIETLNNQELQCRLCNDFAFVNSNLQKHLTNATHLSKMQELTKYISHKAARDYWCKCCNCMIPGIENVYGHMNGFRHEKSLASTNNQEKQNDYTASLSKTMELSKKQELPTKKNIPVNGQSMQTQAKIIGDSDYLLATMTHVETLNNQELHCRVCNEIFVNSNSQEHLTKPTHLSKIQELTKYIYHKYGNNYQCKCCNCTVPGIENIYRHIIGGRHATCVNEAKNQEKLNQAQKLIEPPKQSVTIGKSALDNLSQNHIFKRTSNIYHCKLCDCRELNSANVDEHVAGKRHTEALERFSAEIKTFDKNDKHHCNSCKCDIYSMNNVYDHLHGNKHNNFENKSKDGQTQNEAMASSSIGIVEPVTISEGVAEKNSSNPDDNCHLEKNSVPTITVENRIHMDSPMEDRRDFDVFENSKSSVQTTSSSNEAKPSSNCFEINETKISTANNYTINLPSPQIVSTDWAMEKKIQSQRKSSSRRIPKFQNSEHDCIHNMKDKLRDIELGMKLCTIDSSEKIYCLVCRKFVDENLQNYLKHLSTYDHCEYIEEMEKDHALFELVPGQLSEYDLIRQYMEEISEAHVQCHACEKRLKNFDQELRRHINDKTHVDNWSKLNSQGSRNYDEIKFQLYCDWYDICEYVCVPCDEKFEFEFSFAKHLRSVEHGTVVRKSKNHGKTLIYDFCKCCGLLWYGFRLTFAKHRETTAHVTMETMGREEFLKLPKHVKVELTSVERYINDAIEHSSELSIGKRDKEATLIRDMEMSVKKIFSDAKAYVFGSKISGLSSGNSDYEIFLDCGNMYDGKESSESEILRLMSRVHQCFVEHSECWNVDATLETCDSSILRASHKATGLTCEITFDNGLAVESAKLIKYFLDISPLCRTLILYLNRWLVLCDLAVPQGISTHALHWFVIFYLQKETLLPSVASLIAIENNSHLIDGWEVGVSLNFAINGTTIDDPNIVEYLVKFFTFYANFDYRFRVACPLLGRQIDKPAFADPRSLPEEMGPYIDRTKNSPGTKTFRIDSPMCIQDPLNLQRNLTENVTKANLNRFRVFCSKSSDIVRTWKCDLVTLPYR